MVKYRGYSKEYNPTTKKYSGTAFVSYEDKAKSLSQAKKEAVASSNRWNKTMGTKTHNYKVTKVVELTKKGTIKGRKKPKKRIQNIFQNNNNWRI